MARKRNKQGVVLPKNRDNLWIASVKNRDSRDKPWVASAKNRDSRDKPWIASAKNRDKRDKPWIAWPFAVLIVVLVILALLALDRELESSAGVLFFLHWAQASVGLTLGVASELYHLGCLDRQPSNRLKSIESAIRLGGEFCDLPHVGVVSVRNLTNGYEGKVYFSETEKKIIHTDYLLLKKGPNEIQLKWQVKGEKKPRIFSAKVNRI